MAARKGNTPAVGEVPPSALPFGRETEDWEPGVRPGAGGMGSKPTGKGPRQGNTPHTDTGNNEGFPQRHRAASKKVEKTSENWPTREGGKLNNETT